MIINCLIVDDEPLARKIIREYLEVIPEFEIAGECQDALEAQNILNAKKVDLIYLDISMPKISGMQFIRTLTDAPLVIFTTAHSEYAVEAFEVDAFDYLAKPISFERFVTSVQKVRAFLQRKLEGQQEDTYLNIKEGRRMYHLSTHDVIYLQAYGDYVRIFCRNQTLMPKERLSVIKDQLPDLFLQVHRSYIVNRSEIKFMEGNYIQVASYKIPVSESYRSLVIKYLR